MVSTRMCASLRGMAIGVAGGTVERKGAPAERARGYALLATFPRCGTSQRVPLVIVRLPVPPPWLVCVQVLAISVVQTGSRVDKESIRRLLSVVTPTLSVPAVFATESKQTHYRSHALRGVVCYALLHYVAFFQTGASRWVLCDDNIVTLLSSWDEVVEKCVRGQLAPVLLLYESLEFDCAYDKVSEV
jgi:hypothetical protein